MKTTRNQLIIAHEDYVTLSEYVRGFKTVKAFDRNYAASLQHEQNKATLIKQNELPPEVVRLNSRVIIKEGSKDKLIELVNSMKKSSNLPPHRVTRA